MNIPEGAVVARFYDEGGSQVGVTPLIPEDRYPNRDSHDPRIVRRDYTAGRGLALDVSVGNIGLREAIKVVASRSPAFASGFLTADSELTGGHRGRYGDDVVPIHRVTAAQLVEVIEEVTAPGKVFGPGAAVGTRLHDIGTTLVSILPHLRRALGDES